MPQPKSKPRWSLSLILTSCLIAIAAGLLWNTVDAGAEQPAGAGGVRVERTAFQQPEPLSFEGPKEWINTKPIRLEELRGKLVLLDFWTYCCINCHHVLPDLARLEDKYKNELVVIGVHSPKFFAERDTENIRKKVHEYQIKHPVINDEDQVLWNRFGVSSWPTLVLLDVDGTYLGSLSGEGHYATLDKYIAATIARHKAKGVALNTAPLLFSPESEKPDTSPLSFPGKVLADASGKRLFIADTGHNRIVQAGLDGSRPVVIGNGKAGLANGDYKQAEFNRPQGMCLVDDTLYVADTENHAIRAVDLKSKKVTTVAGTGQQTHRRAGGSAKTTALSSPWDVILIPDTKTLAIAMAGTHQIWRYDIPSDAVTVWAGTGAENIEDGPVHLALFSQPSGLATDGQNLFVADSEVSAIREITIDRRKASVRTIVGSGLFVFGDVDGQGEEVRLQHCLGVAYGDGKLYIADTYNNKVKVCDPKKGTVETFVGSKQSGDSDDPPHFYQPGGLSVANSKLYVADSNNGLIRVVDLKEKTVKTLELRGLTPPAPPKRNPTFPNAKVVDLQETKKVAPNKSDEFTIDVTLPIDGGLKLSPDVAMPYLLETPQKTGILAEESTGGQKLEKPSPKFSVKVKLAKTVKPGDSFPLKLSVASFVCNKDSNVCMVKNHVWNIPVTIASGAGTSIRVGDAPKPEAGRGEASAPKGR